MDTSFYKNPLTCHLAQHLILSAAWKDHKIMVGGNEVLIRRGQVPTGRKRLSEETGLSEQQIRTGIKILKKCGFLTSKSTNKLSIITLCKYNDYQTHKQTNQPTHQPATNQQPTSNQPLQNKGNKINKEYSADFLEFYSAYPLKKAKAKAYQAWKKLKPDLHTCLAALQSQMIEKGFLKAEKKFCPEWKHPATWLNQGCWEDEVETEKKTEKVYV